LAVIQCDIRRGRTADQKRELGEALTAALHEITGLDIDNILVMFREQPGHDLLEGGVVLPDYQAGPNGEDLAGAKELELRSQLRAQGSWKDRRMPYICCDVQEGLTDEQKSRLADEIVRITHEKIGSPIPYIHVAIREFPRSAFVQSGQRNIPYKKPAIAG
jgi:phenylpyruvate tautomerase PptA (4-oxalocrotonate tautomerase family)